MSLKNKAMGMVSKDILCMVVSDFLLENNLSEMFRKFAEQSGYSLREFGLKPEVLYQSEWYNTIGNEYEQ